MTICNGMDTGSWKDLYQYALFESDLNKLPKRIAEAETALVRRARELSHVDGDDLQEEECLDYAMRALHALRSMLFHPALASVCSEWLTPARTDH
jgi:hypothetical protein